MHFIRRAITGVSVCFVNLAVAVLAVANCRPFVHWLHARVHSADWLGSTDEEALAFSDRTIWRLLYGGSMQFEWHDEPFYSTLDLAHFKDVQILVWQLLAVASCGAVWLTIQLGTRRWRHDAYRVIWWSNLVTAVALLALALAGAVAYKRVHRLFHRIFFPQGNYLFDIDTDTMIQLYPRAFWQGFAGGLAGVLITLMVCETIWAWYRTRHSKGGVR